jgi:glyoxylase-like metal-dependent hydrolase (beta-lactamase superfamily II)
MKQWETKNRYKITQVLTGRSNSFLVSNGNSCLLIDTGRKNNGRILIDSINQACTSGQSIRGLVLTHTHFDHAENATIVQHQFGVPVIAHRSEADYLSKGENPPIRGTNGLTRIVTQRLEKKLSSWNTYKPVKADYLAEDKMDLGFLGFDAYLLHTPGHTSGSLSLIVDNDIAIVGDAMFGIIPGSVFPPFAADVPQMVESWKMLLDTGCQFFLPAHGKQRSRKELEKQYVKYRLNQ